MNIAILTQYFPPETGAPQQRWSDLARRLAARGHSVDVLTALPNYPGDEIHPEYQGQANQIEHMGQVRVCRVSLYVPRQKTFLRRLFCYLSFSFNALRFGKRLLRRPDVLLMESPPLFIALAGVPLARAFGAKLVANVSDLWPRTAVELQMIGRGPSLWAAERLEAWMYASSDLITAQTEGIARYIEARTPSRTVVLFPNGVDPSLYRDLGDRQAVRRELGWSDDRFVVVYTGVLGHAQALGQVLDAARRVSSPSILIVMFGDGPCREELLERVRAEGIGNVVIHGHQPAARMPQIQFAADAGLVPLARRPIFEGARPSKMFEIMAAGRPVLLCGRGEAEGVLSSGPDGPAGLVVPAEAPEELARAIETLNNDRALAAKMGGCGRRLVTARFDRAAIAADLEKELEAIVR